MDCTPSTLLAAAAGFRGVSADRLRALITYATGQVSLGPDAPPAAPVATAATDLAITSFTANWNATLLTDSYRLDVSTSNLFGSFVTGYNNKTVAGTSDSVTGLTAATTYYYRVRAVNTAGTSGNSNTITALTTIDPAPCAMVIANGGGDSFDCYTVGSTIDFSVEVAGTGFSQNWYAANSSLRYPNGDSFDTYTVGAVTTDTLGAGEGFSNNWYLA